MDREKGSVGGQDDIADFKLGGFKRLMQWAVFDIFTDVLVVFGFDKFKEIRVKAPEPEVVIKRNNIIMSCSLSNCLRLHGRNLPTLFKVLYWVLWTEIDRVEHFKYGIVRTDKIGFGHRSGNLSFWSSLVEREVSWLYVNVLIVTEKWHAFQFSSRCVCSDLRLLDRSVGLL